MNRFKLGHFALLIGGLARLFLCPPQAGAQQEISFEAGWAVQSSAKVADAPEKISSPGYRISDWYKASMPETVFAVLVENGRYGGSVAAPIAGEIVTAAKQLGVLD